MFQDFADSARSLRRDGRQELRAEEKDRGIKLLDVWRDAQDCIHPALRVKHVVRQGPATTEAAKGSRVRVECEAWWCSSFGEE